MDDSGSIFIAVIAIHAGDYDSVIVIIMVASAVFLSVLAVLALHYSAEIVAVFKSDF